MSWRGGMLEPLPFFLDILLHWSTTPQLDKNSRIFNGGTREDL